MAEHHRSRVRERYFAGGLEDMDDRAVLEMLLFYCIPRKDTNGIAQLLLDRFGSLSGVLEASPEELRSLKGIAADHLNSFGNVIAFTFSSGRIGDQFLSIHAEDNTVNCFVLFRTLRDNVFP